MKKNWDYTIECPTCGVEVPVASVEEEYLNDSFCTACVLELKRKIDSGEIDIDKISQEQGRNGKEEE